MTPRGRPAGPIRIAVIGSGPAAFYVVEHLFKQRDREVSVDMYERLPTPFGLVRFGVAPDHPKIKSVIKVYERLAGDERFRFFGNVDIGTDVLLGDLCRHYHQICFATGAQTDRRLGIPGEDLAGSHAATEFVAWYNGHPEFRHHVFDLTAKRVAVIGIGNVAVDVARILCRTHEELRKTDIADYALEALAKSEVEAVTMLGRRGPAQAAFTNPEVRELGELEGADIVMRPDEVALDDLSATAVADSGDRALAKKISILEDLSMREPVGKARNLTVRFLVSPVEVIGCEGRVTGLRLVHNRLEPRDGGDLRAVPTDVYEDLPVDLVFRSVGYHGIPLADLPFDERSGTVPNDQGRVVGETGDPLLGVYVAGWIKRGPTGVIGTNKPDAGETVGRMLEDVDRGHTLSPDAPSPGDAAGMVAQKQPNSVSYADWQRLDRLEIEAGQAVGRPRIKFTRMEDVFAAIND